MSTPTPTEVSDILHGYDNEVRTAIQSGTIGKVMVQKEGEMVSKGSLGTRYELTPSASASFTRAVCS
jgi:hypothetical protein